MKSKLLLVSMVLVVPLVLAAIACGSGDDDKDSSGGAASSVPAPAPAPAAAPQATTPAIQEISLRAGDWYFDPKEITVKPGTVKVTMNNVGPQFRHTFAIKNKSGEGELFTSDRVDSGQTTTFQFTITEEGRYNLLCVVQGHADRGQTGTLVVAR